MRRLLIGTALVVLGLGYLAMRATDQVFTGIVANKSYSGLTNNLSGEVIYTPTIAGSFRVTSCVENSGHIGGVSTTFNWNDSYATPQSDGLSFSSSGFNCKSTQFRSEANSDITMDTGSINGLGYSVNIYVTVERLQ